MTRRTRTDAIDGRVAAAVVRWRRRRLECAGFTPSLAQRLASDPGRDLHALLELIDRGCPPALAARILAPLDDNTPESR